MAKARSPRYPAISLREALEKVRQVYDNDYQNTIPMDVVVQHMGYGSVNGKSLGVLSAASKFGLLEGKRSGMRVSDRAQIIFEQQPGESARVEALKLAAAEPELFRELEDKFPGRASDVAIRSYLITQRKFLPDAADRVVRSYRDTKDLVAAETGGCEAGNGDQNANIREKAKLKVGDFVQWESGGQFQFKEPWKVLRIDVEPNTGKKFLWCEGQGSDEGASGFVPMDEAIAQAPPEPRTNLAQPISSLFSPPRTSRAPDDLSAHAAPGYRKATFPLDEGDVTILFPEGLSVDGYHELDGYLQVFMRKAKKQASPKAATNGDQKEGGSAA